MVLTGWLSDDVWVVAEGSDGRRLWGEMRPLLSLTTSSNQVCSFTSALHHRLSRISSPPENLPSNEAATVPDDDDDRGRRSTTCCAAIASWWCHHHSESQTIFTENHFCSIALQDRLCHHPTPPHHLHHLQSRATGTPTSPASSASIEHSMHAPCFLPCSPSLPSPPLTFPHLHCQVVKGARTGRGNSAAEFS